MTRPVIIQRGHVPRTRGATGTQTADGRLTEQAMAIAYSVQARTRLLAAGFAVRLIDADPPRSSYAGGLCFVSIHADGSVSAAARGASVGYRTTEGARFAGAWKAHYHSAGWPGGWRADNYTAALQGYYGTRYAVEAGTRFAFIAECGFLTNAQDAAALWPPAGADRFATAITRAVEAVFGRRRTPGPNPQPEPDPQPEVEKMTPMLWRARGRSAVYATDLIHRRHVRNPDELAVLQFTIGARGGDTRVAEVDAAVLRAIPLVGPDAPKSARA